MLLCTERDEDEHLPVHVSKAYKNGGLLHSFLTSALDVGGTAVAQWLRCCATNRKVASSIPAGVIGILH
jgi:hypothetical protein